MSNCHRVSMCFPSDSNRGHRRDKVRFRLSDATDHNTIGNDVFASFVSIAYYRTFYPF